jgi:hypothetical protein
MIIQNKKTGDRRNVTPEQWKTLQDVGFAKHWNMIMRDDPPPLQDAKVLPMDIKEFSKINKPTKKKTDGRRKPKSDS